MSKNEQCLCPPFQLVPGGVRGTGGLADTVVTTPGGNVVPGTGGTGGPVVTPGGTIGGPVVTPGGTIGGAVGLTPAKCKYVRQSSVPETIITIVRLRHLRTLYQNNVLATSDVVLLFFDCSQNSKKSTVVSS